MFDKLQPKQFQLHTISSPSGQLAISQDDTTVTINFTDSFTGNYDFVGYITKSGDPILWGDSSNSYEGNYSRALGGRNNVISGVSDMVVNGRNHFISGSNNLDLNGNTNYTHSGTSSNTILAGTQVGIEGTIEGSTCIKDGSNVTSLTSRGDNTLNIKFDGGNFIEGDVYLIDNVNFGPSSSVTVSGDIDVEGVATLNNSGIALYHDVTGQDFSLSGALSSRIFETGNILNTALAGATNFVKTTGSQFITGTKTFNNAINLGELSPRITETGSSPNYVDLGYLGGNHIQASSKDSIIFVLDHDNNGSYDEANFTGYATSSFIVAGQDTNPDFTNHLMTVNPSGVVHVKDTVILSNPTTVPSTASDGGVSGQLAWDTSYLYVCVDTDTWKRTALSTW